MEEGSQGRNHSIQALVNYSCQGSTVNDFPPSNIRPLVTIEEVSMVGQK